MRPSCGEKACGDFTWRNTWRQPLRIPVGHVVVLEVILWNRATCLNASFNDRLNFHQFSVRALTRISVNLTKNRCILYCWFLRFIGFSEFLRSRRLPSHLPIRCHRFIINRPSPSIVPPPPARHSNLLSHFQSVIRFTFLAN